MLVRVCGASLCMMLFLFFDVRAQHDGPERAARGLDAPVRPPPAGILCVLAAKPRTTSSISGARHHSDKKREGH